MYLWLISFFLQVRFWDNTPFTRTASINRIKTEARTAFENKDFTSAAISYNALLGDLQVQEEGVRLNLAHCYFETNDTANARTQYEKLSLAKDLKIKSVALQQLGVLAFLGNEKQKSLKFTKQALLNNPANTLARYNYEILKRLRITEVSQTVQQPADENQPSENSPITDNQNSNPKRKSKNTPISADKAQAILEAIQNNESQYLQQKRRSSFKNTNKNKPDW
jgi:Ca-activated chloride channel homolog